MLKKDLRALYLGKRLQYSTQSLQSESLTISNSLLALPIWSYTNYHIFLSIDRKSEIDTNFILSILQGKDKNVIIPKMIKGYALENYLLTDNTTLKKNKWGVPEPIDGIKVEPSFIDAVFVPLLAFDKKGNRVGYGKGYYDNFLNNCKPEVLKIGLSLFEAEEQITDVYENDIPLDYCVTPKKTYIFK